MNYKSLLDLLMFKFFTLGDLLYEDRYVELLDVCNKLYLMLTDKEHKALSTFYMSDFNSDYPELSITQQIIDNFPTLNKIKQLLFLDIN